MGMFVSSRYSGGEFAILMPKLTAEKAARLADNFRDFISSQSIDYNNREIDITLSAGVCEIEKGDFSAALTSNYQSLRKTKKQGHHYVVHNVVHTNPTLNYLNYFKSFYRYPRLSRSCPAKSRRVETWA